METAKQSKLCGHVRKWVGEKGWGLINSYAPGGILQKYFVHITSLVPTSATPALGCRVLFVEGPPRSDGELPVALEVEVISASNGKDAGGVE